MQAGEKDARVRVQENYARNDMCCHEVVSFNDPGLSLSVELLNLIENSNFNQALKRTGFGVSFMQEL